MQAQPKVCTNITRARNTKEKKREGEEKGNLTEVVKKQKSVVSPFIGTRIPSCQNERGDHGRSERESLRFRRFWLQPKNESFRPGEPRRMVS